MDSSNRMCVRIKRRMRRTPGLAVSIVLIAILLGAVACSQGTQNPVKAKWIKAQLTGDSVSVPISEINNDKIVHFSVNVALGSEEAFMAYELGGKLYVRANVCPPCRSIGFSLSNDKLVCDTCRTTFNAKTGEGINGACVAYPKASVPYKSIDNKVVMQGSDLLLAYRNTLEPGWP